MAVTDKDKVEMLVILQVHGTWNSIEEGSRRREITKGRHLEVLYRSGEMDDQQMNGKGKDPTKPADCRTIVLTSNMCKKLEKTWC